MTNQVAPLPVVRRVLPNGLTVVVQQDRSHPLVAYQAVVRTGSATEGAYAGTGISHVVEHLLFKGTARRPVGAVEQEARSYGGTSQGFTTYDTTSYQLIVNKEYWSEAADLLVDALFFPSMDPEEFKKELQVVLRELKMGKDDPDHIAWDLLFDNAYRIHPYRMPIIGYEPLLKKLTREDAAAYHRSRYVPNAMVIGIAGDLDPEAAIRRIEQLTANIPTGSFLPDTAAQEPLPIAPREVVQEADLESAMADIGFPSVAIGHPDLFSLDLLSWILGGGRGSRLDKALKETGMVNSISCSNYTPQHPGLFMVSMRMDPPKTTHAVQAVFDQIVQAQRGSFSAAEIESAKKALLHGYLAQRQAVTEQATDIAGYEVMVGDPSFSYRYIGGIQKVTSEDLKRVALEYLKPERATTVKIFPRGTQPAPAASAGSQETTSKVDKIVLPNGLKLLLRQDHRLPLVAFQVSILGGLRAETEKNNGISTLVSRMLLRGTQNKTASEITDLIKQMGGQLAPFSGRNSIGISFEVVSSEAGQAASLLTELLSEPTFPSDELEKERRVLLAELKQKEEDPFPWGIRRLMATLFTVHLYRLDPSGEAAAVAALKREDLEQFYRRTRDPKGMVISVTGDFRREDLLPLLQKSLEDLPAASGGAAVVPAEPPLTSLREHLEVTPRREGLILIGFPGMRLTDPKIPEADMIEAILSGGGGRLFDQVREKRGLAYTVGAFAMHGVDPGAFILYAMADPAQLPTIRTVLLEEVRELAATPAPEDELRRAKQGLLGSRRIARQTQEAVAAQMALDELYGLGYDYPDRYQARVSQVTAQEIQAVAKSLLDPQRCVVVIGRPKEESSGRKDQ